MATVNKTYSVEEITVKRIEAIAQASHRTLSGVIDYAIEQLAQGDEFEHLNLTTPRKTSTGKLNHKGIVSPRRTLSKVEAAS